LLVVVGRAVQALVQPVGNEGQSLNVLDLVVMLILDHAEREVRVRVELVPHQLIGIGVDPVHDHRFDLRQGRRLALAGAPEHGGPDRNAGNAANHNPV
jgi:hypothetical protein